MKLQACGLAMVLLAGGTAATWGEAAPGSSTGTIVLSEHSGRQGRVCYFSPVKDEDLTIRFKDNGERDCENDAMKYLELDGLPSAVIIGIFDQPECKTNEPWAVIRTTQNNVVLGETDLEMLHDLKTGVIVAPGVMKIDGGVSGQLKDRVSCLKIQY